MCMLRACWSQCTQLVEPWYDPLGFASPFILQGRRILQHLCDKNLQWDETVPQSIWDNWQEWKRNIQQLPGVMMHRCLIAKGSKLIKDCSLHHFLDTSEEDYDQVTYLRTVDENNRIFCNVVMPRSCVTPLKFVSGTDCCNISCESSNTPKARVRHQSWWGNVLDWQQSGAELHSEHQKMFHSDISRWNLGIAVLEKQTGMWEEGGRGCCEPPVGLGKRTGGVPGGSTVFLIQNTSLF